MATSKRRPHTEKIPLSNKDTDLIARGLNVLLNEGWAQFANKAGQVHRLRHLADLFDDCEEAAITILREEEV